MRKIFLLTLAACMLLFASVVQAAQITDVKWGVDKSNVLRLVVDITDSAGYAVECSSSALKLTVNANAAGHVPKTKAIRSTVADKLQVIDKSNCTEVHVHLTKRIESSDYKSFVLKKDPQTGRPFRVVVDILADKREPAKSAAEGTAVTTKNTVSNKPVVSSQPVKSTAASVASKNKSATVNKPTVSTKKKTKIAKEEGKNNKKNSEKAVVNDKTTTSKNKELPALKSNSKFRTGGGLKGKIVTLDAGHGGSDPGAVGAGGTKEKHITLAITKRVQELLEKEGAKVYMTRTTDVDVCGPNASDRDELQARVNVAEKNNSDLFVSLHINSSVNKNVGGFSSYYFPKTDNDLKIAQAIQQKLAKNFGVDNLGVRQANFYVIKRSSMPATLLELCFISNAKEEKLMQGNWFQKKAARMIVEGIKEYFE